RDVVVGQKIVLTSSVQLPAGLSISSQSWSNPPGKTVGGFDVIDTATVSRGKKVELPSLNSSGLTFYWVDSGDSRQVTYEYTASNGRSNRATATFNVKGLTGNLKMTPTTRTDGSGVQLTTNGSKVFLEKTGASVPGVANPVGISFQSNATPPSGYNQSF